MNLSTASLIQSKFFSPIFNTAIFDGPVRIYFAQAHEPEALKIYMRVREMVSRVPHFDREEYGGEDDQKIFVLIYPNRETFSQTFDSQAAVCVERLGDSFVVGVSGASDDLMGGQVVSAVEGIVLDWPRPASV